MLADLTDEAVLIVVDERIFADLLVELIESLGGTAVGPAADVEEAHQLLSSESITAAILDFNILDGVTTPVAITLVERAIPFILHTAEPRGIEPYVMAGVPMLRKPSRPARIVHLLAATIAASRPTGPVRHPAPT